jgi:hypothetical protein
MNWRKTMDKQTSFFKTLFTLYSNIKFPPDMEELSQIDKNIAYYLADKDDQFVSSRHTPNLNIVELDIKSAFPTMCRNIFGNDSSFVKKMDFYHNKRERLIYIATTLKETGKDYLNQLNLISKMTVLGIIVELLTDDNILVLELKKDGILFTCNQESLDRLKTFLPLVNYQRFVNSDYLKAYSNYPFTKYLIDSNFSFHLEQYQIYYRCNKTSVYLNNNGDDLIIKGKYKYMPELIELVIYKILKMEDIDLENIRQRYTQKYFNICKINGLNEILNHCYICQENNMVIDRNGNYIKMQPVIDIEPHIYLNLFIYPALLSTKL